MPLEKFLCTKDKVLFTRLIYFADQHTVSIDRKDIEREIFCIFVVYL